jgi:hypothetical protein
MLRIHRTLRNEDGNVLIAVVLISMLVGMLSALTLSTGQQADWASAKDRNREIALGVTEAAVHDAIGRIEQQIVAGFVTRIPGAGNISGSTDSGTYEYNVTRVGDNFVVDAVGTVAGDERLQRKRHVKVTLAPPELFPDAGYALFSKTGLFIKNNNEVYDGDVWANDYVWAELGTIIEGSVTSAQSWVKLENNTEVWGSVTSGHRRCDVEGQNPCTSGFGISLGSGGEIRKFAKASVAVAGCTGEEVNAHKVINDGQILGDVTSFGPIQGSGSVGGTPITDCTSALPRKDPPVFKFNEFSYDPNTYREFGFVDKYGFPAGQGANQFNHALNDPTVDPVVNRANLKGTFVIRECGTDVVNISGSEVGGDVIVITNPEPCGSVKGARIRTDNIGDSAVPAGTKARFILVTHYEPPAGSPCTDSDDTLCAVSSKNHFDSTCRTAMLIYADNGPVSMKNDTGPTDFPMCGSVIASGIHMKNNLQLTYDPVFDRVLGFGPNVYEIARWEELPVS